MKTHYSVWIDVEDIFQYFDANARPSGIQRLVYEILRVIRQQAALRDSAPVIRLVRREGAGAAPALFRPVTFDALTSIFDTRNSSTGTAAAADLPEQAESGSEAQVEVTDDAATVVATRSPPPRRRGRSALIHPVRRAVIRQLEALPEEVGTPLLTIAVQQLQALRLARRWLSARRNSAQATTASSMPGASPDIAATEPSEAVSAAAVVLGPAVAEPPDSGISAATDIPEPGDVFLILGAAWSEHGFGERLARMREAYGVRPVLLIYDLIPALRPEWCARSLIQDFRRFLDTTLPQCGRLLAISQATAISVETYARDNALRLEAPVQTIPIGSGFGERRTPGPRSPGLPRPGTYVLFVSTMEARKNHILAFFVWQRLLAARSPLEVPTLVFAGREGWLVADLLQQLDNTEWLRGKVRLLRDPTDEELTHLYDGCLFTLFPSLFEGWGLPVTESLMSGAPCVASNSTSIPEAGGTLARYFDPENVDDAYRVICDILDDPDEIVRWRQQVQSDFQPVPWTRTADAVLDACAIAHDGTHGNGAV